MNNKKNLLLIFTRNPELGKCKTRLAAKTGDATALEIYKFLLAHTARITKDLEVEKQVYYSESIWTNDIWDDKTYKKELQFGADLGLRMQHAFESGFDSGFEKIIIIGSDMYDLAQSDLEKAFEQLEAHDFVVGPAEDGGYYLLGMTSLKKDLFQNKSWGTETVLSNTMEDLKNEKVFMLPTKNDVDHYEDIKDIEAFQPYLKHIKE
ncbi:TIGR04282 family arsenosugar biosynthesis glycosyltransferase [Flagellimonas sp. 2504JD4-2]